VPSFGRDLHNAAGGPVTDELLKDRFFLGSPDEVAGQIIDYTRKTGINHHVLSCQWPGMPQNMVLDTLQLLAEEVFPRVRQGM
jgi:alkanesulfonate monooxygenase SsuD/methylene tetrahydromethanopterin reductase-like flavin-dependent oxidoreductase (luciferase family)